MQGQLLLGLMSGSPAMIKVCITLNMMSIIYYNANIT